MFVCFGSFPHHLTQDGKPQCIICVHTNVLAHDNVDRLIPMNQEMLGHNKQELQGLLTRRGKGRHWLPSDRVLELCVCTFV